MFLSLTMPAMSSAPLSTEPLDDRFLEFDLTILNGGQFIYSLQFIWPGIYSMVGVTQMQFVYQWLSFSFRRQRVSFRVWELYQQPQHSYL